MQNENAILSELVAIRSILEARQTQYPRRQLMKIPEAAKVVGVSTTTLRKLIKAGRIPAQVINPQAKHAHYIIDINEAVAALK